MGDIVAVVVAETRYQAADAVDAVVVDYDPLEAIVDLEDAASDRVVIHDDLGTNRSYTWTLSPDADAVDRAFAEAAHTVSERYVQQRLIPMAMEPRGVAVVPGVYGGDVTVYSATQIPHILKVMIAATCGVPEQKLRVVAPAVGGGVRVEAQRLRRGADRGRPGPAPGRAHPLDRGPQRERGGHHPGPRPGPAHGAGRRRRRQGDRGAGPAPRRHGRLPAARDARHPAARRLPLPRRLRRAGVPLRVHRACSPTCTPTDAYRGAGRPEATYAIERAMDALAREVGVDAAEIRRRNYIPPDKFPYESIAGLTYDSGNYEPTLDRALELVGYDDLRAEQQRRRDAGRDASTSASASPPTSRCAAWRPAGCWPRSTTRAGGWEAATVRVLPTGKVQVVSGTTPHGQGHETTWSQIVADRLGIDPDDIEVLHSDTAVSPHRHGHLRQPVAAGRRAWPSPWPPTRSSPRPAPSPPTSSSAPRTTSSSSTASCACGARPSKSMTLQAVAFEAFSAHDLPDGIEPNLTAQVTYDPPNFVFPFGTHVAVVEVDEDTGEVELRDYVAVDDCGPQVNPMIVEGQLHGGIVQGVAQALWEEAVYDDDGNLRNPTLIDYCVPERGRGPELPARPHGHAQPDQPARGQGHRRGRDHRLGARPSSTPSSTPCRRSASPTWPCPPTPNGCGPPIQEAAEAVIPAPFDYQRAALGRRGDRAARRSTATTPSCWPAGTRCCRS